MWEHRCQNSFSISVHEEKTKDWSGDKLSSWKVFGIRIAWLLVSCWCNSSCLTCQAGPRVGNILVRSPGRSSNWYVFRIFVVNLKSHHNRQEISSPSKAYPYHSHHQQKEQNTQTPGEPQDGEVPASSSCRSIFPTPQGLVGARIKRTPDHFQ